MKKFKVLFVFLLAALLTGAQQVVPLYSDTIPNSKGVLSETDKPALTIFTPPKEKATGTAVLVIPGGAYQFLAFNEEGIAIAKAFAEKGVAAFVLKYRLPDVNKMRDRSTGPLTDAQQGIKYIRDHAAEYTIDINKVGTIGFSAGGHLASTLGTHFDTTLVPNKENTSLRPDFMVLVYPVISMDNSLTHRGSRINLLGEYPSMDKVIYFCSEEQVKQNTPPAYLTHTGDDQIVDVQNSIQMYQSLLKKGVDAELHLYPKGNHGFIQRLPVDEWLNPILLFLKKEGLYKSKSM